MDQSPKMDQFTQCVKENEYKGKKPLESYYLLWHVVVLLDWQVIIVISLPFRDISEVSEQLYSTAKLS